jgi:hypothetical protein
MIDYNQNIFSNSIERDFLFNSFRNGRGTEEKKVDVNTLSIEKQIEELELFIQSINSHRH